MIAAGFEPANLTELEPKSSALTTRPRYHKPMNFQTLFYIYITFLNGNSFTL